MEFDQPRPRKSLGQHFLKDPHFLRRIAAAARLAPDDQVIEIGPGLGHLTDELATRTKRLIVIELDDRLIRPLREAYAGTPNVEVVHGDALTFDYRALPGSWKVVANLPYYVATPLIQRLIEQRTAFTLLTLMLQKEVAERIAAAPGGKEYGFLSVLVQYHAVPRIEFLVPPGAFTPRPKVDSAVITLMVRERPAVIAASETLFRQVLTAAFGQRRKTLRNALGPLGLPREVLETAARAAAVDLGRRAETLSVDEFVRLANAIGPTQKGSAEQPEKY
jgi:16S rRNA (adenine1518-N6/adenine1519-N6)-dimethyltransferase